MSEKQYQENSSTLGAKGDRELNSIELAQLELSKAFTQVGKISEELEHARNNEQKLLEEISSLKQTLVLQRKKIDSMMLDCEKIGAQREELASLERRLMHISTNPHAALAELLAWRELGMSRLAPSLEVASSQLDILWNYVREMSSPGHRLVSLFGRAMAANWIGRKLRAFLHFLFIFSKSK